MDLHLFVDAAQLPAAILWLEVPLLGSRATPNNLSTYAFQR